MTPLSNSDSRQFTGVSGAPSSRAGTSMISSSQIRAMMHPNAADSQAATRLKTECFPFERTRMILRLRHCPHGLARPAGCAARISSLYSL
uniref:hypothetical protein n=1 Tax=Candidatus Electronema sp. TaxID=2698783 RepID=UPI0040567FF1